MSRKQKISVFIWLAIVALFWIWIFYEEGTLDVNTIAAFLKKFQNYIIAAYFIFSCLRAFTLIPNMTVVMVGTLIIHNPYILLITSVIGLIVSSSLIYFFGEETGLDKILIHKYPEKIAYIKEKIEKYGSPVIFFWGFLPVVPSDLLSFVLGIMKFNYKKFIFYYTVSHIITYGLIIFLGKEFWQIIIPGIHS